MAIEIKKAKKFCGRFAGMPMMPTEKEALDQRADALAKYSRSESHALRVVTAIVEREAYFPTVALIVQECEHTPDDEQVVALRRECPYCRGDGWRSVEGPYGTSAAYPCNHTAEGNPHMGVAMPAVVESHYKRDSVDSKKRQESWSANPKNSLNQQPTQRPARKPPETIRRISEAEINAAVAARKAGKS